MSLSSQYLEELSRRYKKQVEEMQKLLEKTINTLNEESIKKEEQARKLEERIIVLRESIDNLINEKNSWVTMTYWVVLSAVVMLGVLFCQRNTDFKQFSGNENKTIEIHRRKSVDVVSHKTPVKKKRRPSEEALKISGSYKDLMIDEVNIKSQRTKDKKRKRKKQNQLVRSNSITTLNEENTEDDHVVKTVHSEKGFYFAPKSTSSQIWTRQDSAPPNFNSDWVSDTFEHKTDDIPIVLEESEYTSLEPFSYSPVLNKKLLNGNIHSTTYTLTTATDSRIKRIAHKQKNNNGKSMIRHKKSASLDETKRYSTQSLMNADSSSLSNSFDDPSRILEAPKKEKKNVFRRFFKNFIFK